MSKSILFLFLGTFSFFIKGWTQEKIRTLTPVFQKDNSKIIQNTYAIIMGVSNYPHVKPLDYADADAILFRDFLISKSGGSVPADNIKLLINEEATAAKFWGQGYRWLQAKNLVKNDRVYIYLAGHGDAISPEEYYFLTYDSQPANDKINYIGITATIPLHNLKSRIGELTHKGVEVILIIDACRTGDLPGGDVGINYFSGSIAEKKKGDIMFLSAGPDQYAYEDKTFGGGHGLFTYYLVKGLGGEADTDGDLLISFSELEEFVKPNVRKVSNEKYRKTQIPVFCCSEHQETNISIKNEEFMSYLQSLNFYDKIYAGNFPKSGKKRDVQFEDDSFLLRLYNQLKISIKENRFKGNGAASIYLDSMLSYCHDCQLTKDAKVELAVAYLDLGQSKINLYLKGQDDAYRFRQNIKIQTGQEGNGEYITKNKTESLLRIISTEHEQIATYMKEALVFLDNDSLMWELYRPKIEFFDLYSQRNKVNKSESSKWEKRISDLVSKYPYPYIYNLAGLIYSEFNLEEKTINFYQKALEEAPDWVYPINNIAGVYNDKEDYDQALEWYKKAITIDINFVDAYRNIGIVYENLKDYDQALEWYQKAISIDSNFVDAYHNIGVVYKNTKDYTQALEWYQKAISIDSTYVDAYHSIGVVYVNTKDYTQALEYYQKAISIDSTYVDDYYNIGVVYDNLKDYPQALAWYQKAISIDSNYVDAYHNIGVVYDNLKDYTQALEWYQKAISIDSNYVQAYNNIGLSYELRGDYSNALYWYEKTISIDSNFIETYRNIGDVYNAKGDNNNALEWYNKAISIDSNYVVAYEKIAFIYYFQKDYFEAEGWFIKSLQKDSTNFNYWLSLGAIYNHNGDYKKAIDYFDNSLKLRVDALTYRNKGNAYEGLLNYVEAEKFYLKALEVDSLSCDCAQTMLMSLYKKTKNEAGINRTFLTLERFYSSQIKTESDGRGDYVNLAYLYLERKDFEKALEYFNKTLEVDPENSSNHYNLACFYAITDDIESALSYIEQALAKGYKNYEHIIKDTDLEPIRSNPRFKTLMEKYFPDKYKR